MALAALRRAGSGGVLGGVIGVLRLDVRDGQIAAAFKVAVVLLTSAGLAECGVWVLAGQQADGLRLAAGTPWTSCAVMPGEPPGAWSLDGQPLLGISVFAILGLMLEELLARRFASFRTIYLPAAGELRERGFELLAALSAARPNPQYGRSSTWREEG